VLAWSRDGARLAFSRATARETRNVWILDFPSSDPGGGVEAGAALGEISSGSDVRSAEAGYPAGPTGARLHRVTAATQAGIPPDRLVEPELVAFPTFDGRDIPAFLYPPPGASPDGSRAAVVIFHGGPESQARPELTVDTQFLALAGYVVLVPNVRGSSGYGRAYLSLDDVERRMDAVADGQAAAQWLVSSGWAHPERIAAMGGSYGGFMTLSELVTYPQTWAAGVALFGIANFVTFLENTHPFRRRLREAEYGSLERHRAVLERISPIHAIDRIRAPLLVVHGETDPRVPISETEQLVAALEARGVPVAFIRFPDEGHGIVRPANRQRLYPAIAEFLDSHLAPRP
jgi:dipeptidyl aminopeptidase/acylaminoacyl peptidase